MEEIDKMKKITDMSSEEMHDLFDRIVGKNRSAEVRVSRFPEGIAVEAKASTVDLFAFVEALFTTLEQKCGVEDAAGKYRAMKVMQKMSKGLFGTDSEMPIEMAADIVLTASKKKSGEVN